MVITWYGQSCFKIQSGPITIILDPFNKSIGLIPPKIEADLVLITHDHSDHNNLSTIKGTPFVVDGPGEYEHKGVRIKGIATYHDNSEGSSRGANTVYTIMMEGISIVHLGDIGQEKLIDSQLENIGSVDILMVPVGGVYTVGAASALEIINQIEPRIVVPMHYKVKGLKIKLAAVDEFLKEIGQKNLKPIDKITLKKNALPQEKMEVIVLTY